MNAPRKPFLTRFLGTLDRSNLPMLASALTFDAILALIPMTILVVGGVGLLLNGSKHFGTTDPSLVVSHFFPTDIGGGQQSGTVALIQRLLVAIKNYQGQLTVYAIPAFLWFSTRLFGSIRGALSRIFQVPVPTSPHGVVITYLLGYGRGKLQDLATVGFVFVLALLNTLLSTALSLLTNPQAQLQPPWTFLVSAFGHAVGIAIALASGWALFTLLYRYASPKRMAWKGALLAGAVAGSAFELAKFLYGSYVRHMANSAQYSFDANVGAVLLLILWIWYTSLVFLGGAAVADAWDQGRVHRGPEAVEPLLENVKP